MSLYTTTSPGGGTGGVCCLLVRSLPFIFRRGKQSASQPNNLHTVGVVKFGWRKDETKSNEQISNLGNRKLNCVSKRASPEPIATREVRRDQIFEYTGST